MAEASGGGRCVLQHDDDDDDYDQNVDDDNTKQAFSWIINGGFGLSFDRSDATLIWILTPGDQRWVWFGSRWK